MDTTILNTVECTMTEHVPNLSTPLQDAAAASTGAVMSLRYQLTLAEAKDGFALATFAKNKFSRFVTPVISIGIVLWGLSLGLNGVGRYYVLLGATFLILQFMMRLWVLPALFSRQYRHYGYGKVTQGLDLYQDYVQILVADRQQRFAYTELHKFLIGQSSYVLELKNRTVVIVPKRTVSETGQQAWFESVLNRA